MTTTPIAARFELAGRTLYACALLELEWSEPAQVRAHFRRVVVVDHELEVQPWTDELLEAARVALVDENRRRVEAAKRAMAKGWSA